MAIVPACACPTVAYFAVVAASVAVAVDAVDDDERPPSFHVALRCADAVAYAIH